MGTKVSVGGDEKTLVTVGMVDNGMNVINSPELNT